MAPREEPHNKYSSIIIQRPIKKNFGYRHVQIILLLFYNIITFAQLVNLSVAIVPMVDNKNNHNFEQLNLDEFSRGTILSSAFWGTSFSSILAGIITQKINCKTLLTALEAISSLATLLLPLAAKYNWQSICVVRFIVGITIGFWQPCMHTMLSIWIHPTERTFLSTLAYSGGQIGIIVTFAVSGFIATSPMGWPGIFYLSGGCGLLWTIIWYFYGSNSPSECLRISEWEKSFLMKNSSENLYNSVKDLKKLPIRAIMKSSSFWALVVASCGGGLAYNFFATEIPTYINNILGFNIQSSSLLSSLPYIIFFCLSPVLGYSIDFLIKRKYCSIGLGRKIANTIGMLGPAMCLIILGHTKNVTFAMIMLTAALTLECGVNSGSFINHMDLSPNFSGLLTGFTLAAGNMVSILAPMLVGCIVTDKCDANLWRIVFYILGSIFFICNLIFCIWGSGEIQRWNKIDNNTTSKTTNYTQSSIDNR